MRISLLMMKKPGLLQEKGGYLFGIKTSYFPHPMLNTIPKTNKFLLNPTIPVLLPFKEEIGVYPVKASITTF